MGRSRFDQDTQVWKSGTYDDSIAPSVTNYQTNPVSLQDDLNCLRSMASELRDVRTGSWYDALQAPATYPVGGAATLALKEEVAAAIEAVVGGAYEVEVVTDGPYAGTDPANLVNWLTATGGGVQIEQPSGARTNYWQQIADAVASVFASKL